MVSGRRLIVRDQFRALRPTEIVGFDACTATKCSAVRFAAHGAMTVERVRERAADLVPDTPAEAAASKHQSPAYFVTSLAAAMPARRPMLVALMRPEPER